MNKPDQYMYDLDYYPFDTHRFAYSIWAFVLTCLLIGALFISGFSFRVQPQLVQVAFISEIPLPIVEKPEPTPLPEPKQVAKPEPKPSEIVEKTNIEPEPKPSEIVEKPIIEPEPKAKPQKPPEPTIDELTKQKELELQRQEQQELAEQTARKNLADLYISRIKRRVESQLNPPTSIPPGATSLILLNIDRSGNLNVLPVVLEESGYRQYENEIQRAILRSLPLPLPYDNPDLLEQWVSEGIILRLVHQPDDF